ncbi:hypothetical protein EXIGLDRAFT_728800 [Exidia glandulosa HHB12029]|uniref:Cleavage/polyadenylation specificity factor A subunit N-terminal domain-containing protein n=1 Tax=Exidia glandulosa HHB12029 TaxID=1314781 RepID=A0A165CV95_EXIGL|nr:hypothetical protein EXIGLDRAFT_728800 [Exidia glandulosa HHB12029]
MSAHSAQRSLTTRTVAHVAERVYIHDSYVVTFGPDETSTNLWILSDDGRALEHLKALKTLEEPGGIAPIVDVERKLVAITRRSSGPPELHICDIDSGDLMRTLMLYGSLDDVPMPYSSRLGRALVATRVVDELPRVLVVDVAGNGWIEGVAYIPPDLRTSTDDRPDPLFGAEHITDDGDIICSYVAPPLPDGVDHFTLMRWTGTPNENTLPAVRADLPISLVDGDAVSVSCCLPFRDDALLVSACEAAQDGIDTAYSRWSVLRAIGIRALDPLWTAEPVWGVIRRLHHAVDAGVVIANGTQNAREDAGKSIPVSFIAAFDDQTGALRRLERVNYIVQGVSVRLCAATSDTVIVVFANGDVSITALDDFLANGLARDVNTHKVMTTRLWKGHGKQVVHAAIAASSVIVATQTNLVVASW